MTKLTFFGGTKSVTGANYLLENSGTKILVDCGLRQGSRFAEKQNFEPFPYQASQIGAVFITHAHIDHTGLLPKLYKAGFRGRIYSTAPTKDFAEHLLLDSERLLRHEAEALGKEPLYNIEDINSTLKLWHKTSYHEPVEAGSFQVEFLDAGHILGSASLLITAPDNKKICFSGDLGNSPNPLLKNKELLPKDADYVLMESVYGARQHETETETRDLLEDTIEETIKRGGVLMIPAFSLERTQKLLYEINYLVENKKIPEVPVFLDSPLAIKLTSVYKKYSQNPAYFNSKAIQETKAGDEIFNFPRLNLTLTTEQSKQINQVPPPKIILAGSGMSEGGRILHHERRYLPDPKSTLLIVGYQVTGSRGRAILEGAKQVEIFGDRVPVRCQVKAIGGYSAHADQPQLLEWLEPARHLLKKLFLVQGEPDQMLPLKHKIQDTLTVSVEIPDYGNSQNL